MDYCSMQMKRSADWIPGKVFISKMYYNMRCIVIYPNEPELEDTDKIAINWQLCIDNLTGLTETSNCFNTFDGENDSWMAVDTITKEEFIFFI